MSFKNSLQYRTLHAGAHRRSAARMSAPGLTWHLAFREPHQELDPMVEAAPASEARAPVPPLARLAWRKNVDRFLSGIFREMTSRFDGDTINVWRAEPKNGAEPDVDSPDDIIYFLRHGAVRRSLMDARHAWDLDYDRLHADAAGGQRQQRYDQYETFQIDGNFLGFPLSIRAMSYHEYWTLTFLLSFDRRLDSGLADTPDARLLARIAAKMDLIAGSSAAKLEKYWQRRDFDPLDKRDRTDAPYATARRHLVDDFRGLIRRNLLDPALGFALGRTPTDIDRPARIGLRFADFVGTIFGLSFCEDPGAHDVYPADGCVPDIARAVDVLRVGAGQQSLTIHGRVIRRPFCRFAAPQILDAFWPAIRAIHTPVRPASAEKRFSEYTEAVAARFQSSRALYVSTLGRMHAAEFDPDDPVVYTIIVNYSSHWQLGRLVERLHQTGTWRLAALWDFARIKQAHHDMWALQAEIRADAVEEDLPHRARGHVRRMHAIETSVTGELTHRLSRAEYYITQIETNLPKFRQGRVEGFQQYDEFIHRRLFPSFEFIRRTRAIHAELRKDFELASTRSVQLTIRELLDRAEYLIAAPVIYYGGNILGDWLKWPIGVRADQHPKEWAYLATVALGLAILIYRLRCKRRGRAE